MNFKKLENKRGESRKSTSHKRGAVRHSSPILDSDEVREKNQLQPSQIRPDHERGRYTNRSSNISDVSLPGQNLHTDSGISSSDSLAGCDKRFSSSEDPDVISDLIKHTDDKLTHLNISENVSSKISEAKLALMSSKFSGDTIVFPVHETDLSLECNPSGSVFMTAMDSDLPMPDSDDHLSPWHEEESTSPDNSIYDKRDAVHQDSRLYCSACGEQFTNPRLLPCLHTFCLQCLESQLQTTNDSDQSVIHSGMGVNFSPRQLVSCPTCSAEVEVSLEGVHSLPVNHFIKRLLLLQNLQTGDVQNLTCDLCPDDSSISGTCVQCQSNLCQFCVEAHKRQRHTSCHTLFPVQGGGENSPSHQSKGYGLRGRNVPMICQRHTGEEMKLYCVDCSQLVCRDCCLSAKHKDHKCEYLNLVINHKISEIRHEFQICEPKIQRLRHTIATLVSSEKLIEDTASEVSGKVERHISSYIKALEKHRDSLLASINQRTTSQMESIRDQQTQLEKILKDLSNSCDFTSQLLGLGTHSEILALKPTIVERLRHLSELRYSETPCPVGNFVEFRANKKVKVWIEGDVASCMAGSKRSSRLLRPGLEVDLCGDVVSHVVDPKYCTAHGEGIHCSRVKLPSEFTVIAKNCEREKLDNGGDDVSVFLTMNGIDQNLIKKPKIQIVDKQDGTYRVLYVVHVTGTYILKVQIYGKDIHGSPFMVTAVESKAHVHTGIFHCCCFCSSGGDKNSTCACGAKMQGGYLGCGHGHDGHPGSAHWSCCGKVVENSSCSKSSISGPPPENLDIHNTTPKHPLHNPRRSGSLRSCSTLPSRGSLSNRYGRSQNVDDHLYATPSTIKTQTRGQFDPKMYFAKYKSQSDPKFQTSKPVKTISL